MALSRKVVSFALNTTTGNQQVTGVGFQGKAGIILGSSRASDGTAADAFYAYGFMVSSSQRGGIGSASGDANAGGLVGNTFSNARCLRVSDKNATLIAAADFVSWGSDDFTINVVTAPATAIIIHVLVLGGSDITDAWTGTIAARTGSTGTQSYTSVGFQGDLGIIMTPIFTTGTADTGSSTRRMAFGVFKSSTARWYNCVLSANGSPSNARRVQKTNKCIGTMASDGTPLDEADFSAWLSNGFTFDWTTISGAASTFFVLILKGGSHAVGSFNQPTSTGNQTTSGLGMTPSGLLLSSICNTSSATHATHARHAMGLASDTSNRGALWSGETHNVTTTVAKHNLDRTKVLKLMTEASGGPTTEASADLSSFGSGQFELTWGTADATARDIAYWAMGDNPSTGATGTGTPAITLPTAAGSGIGSHPGAGTPVAPLPTASGVGHAQPRGQGAPAITLPTASGTAVASHPGSGTPTAPLPTAAGTGVASRAGTGALVVPLPTAAGTATASHTGTGAPAVPLPTAAGSGVAAHVGAGTPVTPLPTAAGTGIGGDEVAGSGAPSIPLPTASGVGHAQPRGQGAPLVALPTAAGTGTASHPGTGSPTVPKVTAAGVGVAAHVGSGSPTTPLPTAAGTGSGGGAGTATGSGAPAVPAATAAGTGVVTSVFVLILQRIAVLEGNIRRLSTGRARSESDSMEAKLNRILEMVLETQKQARRR